MTLESDAVKGLDYYLANPGELDQTDKALMDKLLVEAGTSEAATDAKVDPAAAPTDKGTPGSEGKTGTEGDQAGKDAAATAAAGDKTKGADADKLEPAPVLTRDGKHTIPFAVLEDARQKALDAETARTKAEQEAAELRAKLDEAIKAKPAATAAEPDKTTAPATSASARIAEIDAQIAEVEAESPWMAKTLRLMRDQLVDADARATAAEREAADAKQRAEKLAQDTEADRAHAAGNVVREAIDNNPALVYWEAKNKAMWDEAINFDKQLRERPEWANKTYAERFDKVVELVTTMHGKDILPPGTPSTDSKGKDAVKAPDPAKTRALAEEAAKAAQSGIATLSDIPGGQPVEGSAIDIADAQSISQLGTMFMNMSPDQQQAWLAKNA